MKKVSTINLREGHLMHIAKYFNKSLGWVFGSVCFSMIVFTSCHSSVITILGGDQGGDQTVVIDGQK